MLRFALVWMLVTAVAFGCAQSKVEETAIDLGPDYSRPLPPGQSALRLITDMSLMPDLAGAYRNRDVFLLEAIDQSLKWFEAPSSKQWFPFEGITHEQARASVREFGRLVESAANEQEFVREFHRRFNVYQSVGYNGEGVVLFTGYYSPIFNASRTRTSRFNHPLYTRPDDLATDPRTGEPQGRRMPDGSVRPYATRAEIESSRMFQGSELVWLEDALSAFIIHVNGSAKLRLGGDEIMHVGYAGKTDRPYTGLGASMVAEGLLTRNQLGLPAIRRMYRQQPAKVEELILRNENYVFFTEYRGDNWPAGSLGVRVTRESSLATDKRIYPRGGIVLADTQAVTFSQGRRQFLRFMLDQDTGGAINAPGRADIFMGVGLDAEILAGGQYAEGRLYYIVLKPDQVSPGSAVAGAGF
ncbi:MAG TPA: MltA domain-containing protein [Phycisphaerales bacterium]|nr:MltA domain-containing protein [Phycisphaerales bacterium]HRQ74818.1 MltA domain-containing protein [Phycisphaerales bacterium]